MKKNTVAHMALAASSAALIAVAGMVPSALADEYGPSSGVPQTVVEYGTDSTYTIEIPASVKINDAGGDDTYLPVTATEVNIAADKAVNVYVSAKDDGTLYAPGAGDFGTSKLTLTGESDAGKQVSTQLWLAQTPEGGWGTKMTNFPDLNVPVAQFKGQDTQSSNGNIGLYLNPAQPVGDNNPIAPGKYTNTLTFTIKVEDAAGTSEGQ